MVATIAKLDTSLKRVLVLFASCVFLGTFGSVHAQQSERSVEIRLLDHPSTIASPQDDALRSIAFEVVQRTSIEARATASRARLDDESLFASPLIFWRGDRGFDRLSDAQARGLRRFIDAGGMLVVDDANATASFDLAFRREIARIFPGDSLHAAPRTHTLAHAYYMLTRYAAQRGDATVEILERNERAAIVYVRSGLFASLARDPVSEQWRFEVTGGEPVRELVVRFAVNIVMYAMCLDYKDDQVHAPFLMRRRNGAAPP